VLDGLDNVTGTGLTLGADHGSTFGDAAEGLAEVTASADEGNLEVGLGDVVKVVGGGEDFRLVDVIDTNGFEDLIIGNISASMKFSKSFLSHLPGIPRSVRYEPWP
jgi:hypothetical protein